MDFQENKTIRHSNNNTTSNTNSSSTPNRNNSIIGTTLDEIESKYKYYLLEQDEEKHPSPSISSSYPKKKQKDDGNQQQQQQQQQLLCRFSSSKNSRNNKIIMTPEIEKYSLSECTIEHDFIFIKQDETTQEWTEHEKSKHSNDNNNNNNNKKEAEIAEIIEEGYTQLPVTKLTPGTTIRIPPMEWNSGGWSEEHFHDAFKLPPNQITFSSNTANITTTNTSSNKGMIVTLQAKARECVTVALSPTSDFTLGKTYAIHIGAAHNLQTVIRRRLPSQTEAIDITIPTPHVCSTASYINYWIIIQGQGQVSVGFGTVPGRHCFGTLDDSMYHALRSGVDAVKFVGLGNSALGRKARDVKIRNVQIITLPGSFVFKDGLIPLTKYDRSQGIQQDGTGGDGTESIIQNEKDAALWDEYQKECIKAQKRAEKFSIPYKQPPPDAFFKWSEAKRMRENPERGFITGMDISSEQERIKANKRKERFELEDKKRIQQELLVVAEGNGYNDNIDMADDENGNGGTVSYGGGGGEENTKKQRDPLPFEQAWDNIDLVQQFRFDTPQQVESDAICTPNNNDENMNDIDNDEVVPTTTLVPEKIHLFAIDWAAFKQIRTEDILSYFSMYGPSYVEWLGELSCNVLFGDKYSAARAMEGMSRALPLEVPNLNGGDSGFMTGVDITSEEEQLKAIKRKERFECKKSDEEGADSKMNEEDDTEKNPINEEQGMTTEIDNDELKQESTNLSNDGADNDKATLNNDAAPNEDEMKAPTEETESTSNVTNLGKLGWRFCNYPIRKRQDDRYGRRGTRSRVLMRAATNLDVLEERPTSWPKPPPGFSTRHILGPGSDFKVYSRKRGRGDNDGGGKRRRRYS